MENSYETSNGDGDKAADLGLQIIRHPSFQPCTRLSLSWFDLRVFYVRISNFVVDDSTPECLTVNHVPLSLDTVLEVNGVRCAVNSEGISSLLRRDRVDKKSEEATFVSTDNIRLTGSVKFEVFDKNDLLLNGVLEMSNANGSTGEFKSIAPQWSLNCEPAMAVGSGFLKGKRIVGSLSSSPTLEVYVTGRFLGTPIILTKTLQLSRKKHNRKGTLNPIPENESTESPTRVSSGFDLQVAEHKDSKPESEDDYDMSWRRQEHMEGDDGELSWFNAGVRVGVGIGLGICLGIGIGVGLLVRSYQVTTRNFKRRLA